MTEKTFREVGEGTNKSTDLDQDDLIYYHLFAWDKDSNSVVGAYRLGKGNELLSNYGRKGFYISELFRLKKGLKYYLMDCLEMGRSFCT